MNQEFLNAKSDQNFGQENETFTSGNEIIIPAVDLLMSDKIEGSSLPLELKTNQEIINQAKLRREILAELNLIFAQVPVKMELIDALNQDLVSVSDVQQFYEKLTDFLASDKNNSRILLYLPFELIPEKSSGDSPFDMSKAKFLEEYMNGWHYLLGEHDVRANFTDGNILEPELVSGGPARVSKAAHLLPKMITKGLIESEKVIEMIRETSDSVLKQSLLETIPVLQDLNLIDHDLVTLIKDQLPEIKIDDAKLEVFHDYQTLLDQFGIGLERIEADYSNKLKNQPELQSRWEWEKSEQTDQIIAKNASILSQGVEANQLEIDLLFLPKNELQDLVTIEALHLAVEKLAQVSVEKAQNLVQSSQIYLKQMWQSHLPKIQDRVMSCVSYWTNAGIISEDFFKDFGLEIPKLDFLTENQQDKIQQEIESFTTALEQIQSDPYLSQALLPTFVFFGSKLKGYAHPSADLDLAVFVKPGFDFSRRPEMLEKLNKVLANFGVSHPTEFWLEEKGDLLAVKEVPLIDNAIAEKDWAHIILQGEWFGKKPETNEIYQKLIMEYFQTEARERFPGVDNRRIWLRELEREVLQYRLMHKGYNRFYPKINGLETKNSKLLDTKSSFWDPGFRRLAAKLFLSKVFIPQINN